MPLRIVHTFAISPAETFGVTAGTTLEGGGATGQFATGPGRGAGCVTAPGSGAGATDPGRGAAVPVVPAGPPFGVPGAAPAPGVTAGHRSAQGWVTVPGRFGSTPGVVVTSGGVLRGGDTRPANTPSLTLSVPT